MTEEITTENITPVQPNKTPKTIPWNKWTITGFIIGGLFLVGIGGAMGGGTPEPEVRTVTETQTVTEEIEVSDTQELRDLQSKVDQCQDAVQDMAVLSLDLMGVIQNMGEAVGENNIGKAQTALETMNRLNDGPVTEIAIKARTCNPNINLD